MSDVRQMIEVEPLHQLGLDQPDGISTDRDHHLVHAAIAAFPVPQTERRPWWKVWQRVADGNLPRRV